MPYAPATTMLRTVPALGYFLTILRVEIPAVSANSDHKMWVTTGHECRADYRLRRKHP